MKGNNKSSEDISQWRSFCCFDVASLSILLRGYFALFLHFPLCLDLMCALTTGN